MCHCFESVEATRPGDKAALCHLLNRQGLGIALRICAKSDSCVLRWHRDGLGGTNFQQLQEHTLVPPHVPHRDKLQSGRNMSVTELQRVGYSDGAKSPGGEESDLIEGRSQVHSAQNKSQSPKDCPECNFELGLLLICFHDLFLFAWRSPTKQTLGRFAVTKPWGKLFKTSSVASSEE